MNNLINHSLAYCQSRKAQGLFRNREIKPEDNNVLHFSSSDYLSLKNNAELKAAYMEGHARYSSGATGSALICGYQNIHCQAEEAFAVALQVEAAILFSSGYSANLSVAMLIAALGAEVFIDKYIHASIYDGLRLSEIPYYRYPHLKFSTLKKQLSKSLAIKVLYTESVFSMGGDKTPFDLLIDLQKSHELDLIVDEAHAFGVYGPEGLGALTEPGLEALSVPLRIIPLGKAACASGAIVAGNKNVIEALVQVARPYIYSTAISPAFTHGILHTLSVIRNSHKARSRLFSLIAYFRSKINASNFSSPYLWKNSHTPIQHLVVGCPFVTLRLNDKLKEYKISCIPIRSPTVPKSETGFRVIINAGHTEEDIDTLFNVLHEILV